MRLVTAVIYTIGVIFVANMAMIDSEPVVVRRGPMVRRGVNLHAKAGTPGRPHHPGGPGKPHHHRPGHPSIPSTSSTPGGPHHHHPGRPIGPGKPHHHRPGKP
ncbi:hypothetical protein BDF19DRAFT_425583 [Syncephalis fuscata]|nr:hypothetical protein BDF19DRAFT_425583 [Syncephalis fuscata]